MGPLAFLPLFHERVWGGRELERRLGKALPPDVPIGESWELVDRDDAQSMLVTGGAPGTTLHELWEQRREEVFGPRARDAGPRFPLLLKLLDAREVLSVQVHPPAEVAGALGGEPKSEFWYLADADPGAHLLVGLRAGVTRETFGDALRAGEDVSGMLQRVDVTAGDAMYLPSGRVHAIGPGCLIVEVQQSSDTTYRVYDFDRPGLDGRPRDLHVEEALASIDFGDVEPPLLRPEGDLIASTPFFTVRHRALDQPQALAPRGECAVVVVLDGVARCGGSQFTAGEVFLLPAAGPAEVAGPGRVLTVELPEPGGRAA